MRFARGSAWVGVGRWWRRAPQREFGPEDGGQSDSTCRLGETNNAVEPVVVGKGERA